METGDQMLARLNARSDEKTNILKSLEQNMFPGGVVLKQIIELIGETGSGKTQYMTHMICTAILPKSCSGLEINVILIDIDHIFSLHQLTTVLEHRITTTAVSAQSVGETDGVLKDSHCDTRAGGTTSECDDVEKCLMSSLARLYIMRCSTTTQLLINLQSLESAFSSRMKFSLLFIDSLTALFPADGVQTIGAENLSRASDHLLLVLEALAKISQTYSVLVIITNRISYDRQFDRTYSKHASKHRKQLKCVSNFISKVISDYTTAAGIPLTQLAFTRQETSVASAVVASAVVTSAVVTSAAVASAAVGIADRFTVKCETSSKLAAFKVESSGLEFLT